MAALLLAAGCDSSPTAPSSHSPSARFEVRTQSNSGGTYVFDAALSIDTDPQGWIKSYEWNFGDGETASGEVVTHTYASDGEKQVTLTVTDGSGATDTATQTIFVETTSASYNYESEYAYNVNVIYFVPSNMDPRRNYRERYSEILLYIQDYYRKWMGEWGYPNTTFGLMVDEDAQIVEITQIEGDEPLSHYATGQSTRGANRMRREIKDYFQSNAGVERDSKHYLVIAPRYGSKGNRLPYFAITYGPSDEGWGWVTDRGQNGVNPIFGTDLEFMGGGIAHELGHAINLPHNAHPLSRKRGRFGEALMSAGNHTWNNNNKGSTFTSLTEADADILSQSQVFSRSEGNFYGPIDATLTSASGSYSEGYITISGTFESDVTIHHAVLIMDPAGQGQYNRHSFSKPVADPGNFSFRIPITDLRQGRNGDKNYTVRLWLVPEHRRRKAEKLTEFSFENGVPNINFDSDVSQPFITTPTKVVHGRHRPAEMGRSVGRPIVSTTSGSGMYSLQAGPILVWQRPLLPM